MVRPPVNLCEWDALTVVQIYSVKIYQKKQNFHHGVYTNLASARINANMSANVAFNHKLMASPTD